MQALMHATYPFCHNLRMRGRGEAHSSLQTLWALPAAAHPEGALIACEHLLLPAVAAHNLNPQHRAEPHLTGASQQPEQHDMSTSLAASQAPPSPTSEAQGTHSPPVPRHTQQDLEMGELGLPAADGESDGMSAAVVVHTVAALGCLTCLYAYHAHAELPPPKPHVEVCYSSYGCRGSGWGLWFASRWMATGQ